MTMNRLYLKRPDGGDEARVLAYRDEHFSMGDFTINGGAGLANVKSFDEWLMRSERNGCEETVMPGLVPESTFLAIRAEDDQMVGIINVRHRLNDFLFSFGGHIGYGIRPGERGKGYATEMLALALEECRKLGLDRVLLTCDRDNPASANVMLKNSAVLENEVDEDGTIVQRYWIAL